MNCPRCGKENLGNANYCEVCGEKLDDNVTQVQNNSSLQAKPQIKDYMVFSILTTIFCCIPFGIIAIVYSSKVSKLIAAGDFEGASNASRNSKIWNIAALVSGIVLGIICILLYAGIFTSVAANYL